MSLEALTTQISTALGASWASGVNLYATVLTLGVMDATGAVVLPEGIDYVSHPLVMIAAGIMFSVEFFADKIPGIDSLWDSIHTFVRIPAGIVMAYGAAEGMGPIIEVAMGLMGGGLATTSHVTKAGGRALINTSPEPFTNWTASVTEDAAAVGGVYLSVTQPWIFFGVLGIFILLAIWLLPKIARTLKRLFGFLGRLLGFKGDPGPDPALSGDPGDVSFDAKIQLGPLPKDPTP